MLGGYVQPVLDLVDGRVVGGIQDHSCVGGHVDDGAIRGAFACQVAQLRGLQSQRLILVEDAFVVGMGGSLVALRPLSCAFTSGATGTRTPVLCTKKVL